MKIITFLFSIIILLQVLQAQTNTGTLNTDATVVGDVYVDRNNGSVLARAGHVRIKYYPINDTTDITEIIASATGGYILYGLSTGVDDENPALPTDFKIKDVLVTANPGEAHEIFSLSNEKPLSIKVYNLLGQEVRSLKYKFDKLNKITGTFWDGKNNFGKYVTQGIYFVTIETKNDIFSSKLLQMKNGIFATQNGITNSIVSHFKKLQTIKKNVKVNKIASGMLYAFEFSPTDSSAQFHSKKVVHEIVEGYQTVKDTVNAITDKVDYTIKLEDIYTTNNIEGITVRWIEKYSGEEHIGTTNENGEVEFEDLSGSMKILEIDGGNEYLSVSNFEFNFIRPQEASDTARVQVYGMVPKQLPVPGTNGETIEWSKWEQGIRFGHDSNPEMHLGRKENLYLSMNDQQKQAFMNLLAKGDSLFFMPNQEPWYRIVDTPRNITADMKQNYHPYHNFYEGAMGWNISLGANLTRPIIALYGGENVILGGSISVAGDLYGFFKELYGRLIDHTDMLSGFMTLVSGEPTYTDRAYVCFRNTFKGYKWKNDGDIGRLNHYELDHLVE